MPLDKEQLSEAAAHVSQNPFLVGLLGGVVALRGVPGASFLERVFNSFSAMLIAGFGSPATSEFFGLTTPAMQSACAFAIGLFGLNLVSAVTAYLGTVDIASLVPWGRKGK